MTGSKRWTWWVEGTVPTDTNGRVWQQNINLQVIASTLQEAVDGAIAKYPEITLHKCWRDRNIKGVIVVGGDDAHSD